MKFQLPELHFRKQAGNQADLEALLLKYRAKAKLALNPGYGEHPVAGVVNCDLHSSKADVVANITSLPIYADESVQLIEINHASEHLALSEVVPAIQEWWRLLCTGGILVITCPALDQIAHLWHKGPQSHDCYILKMLFGFQKHPGIFHKSCFSGRLLAALLTANGFYSKLTFSPFPKRRTPWLLVGAEKKDGR